MATLHFHALLCVNLSRPHSKQVIACGGWCEAALSLLLNSYSCLQVVHLSLISVHMPESEASCTHCRKATLHF